MCGVDLNACRAARVDDFVQLCQAAPIGEGPETTNNDENIMINIT
jgi:hypothetical protein